MGLMQIRNMLKGFARDNSAVAAVEFAIVMPLLLVLYFGTLETSRMLSEDRRLTQVSASLGDLVAQAKKQLPKTTLDDYFLAAEITLAPYDTTSLTQVVTSVYIEDDGTATVLWSFGHKITTPYAKDDKFVLPSEFLDVASNRYVIVSEASVTYDLLTRFVFENGIDLHRKSYFVPRFGDKIDII